ncbi:MAG TPA: hypothetical protein V6D16_21130 [Candidatus Obscuribacterales bacterium]
MQAQWQKTFKQLTFWLVAEIILNLSGLDNLADYSEFVFEQELLHGHSFPVTVVAVILPRTR